jgi:predicted adenylyl cyclase CyaB
MYDRKESKRKRVSNYLISETSDFKELDIILRTQFEVLIKVEKLRNVYLSNNVRVHIDIVKNLGKFLEIEIIYDNFSHAVKQMAALVSTLGLDESRFIKVSYSDLLINRK